MTEYFTPDGHLTDAALTGLMNGSLDETQRLEVGEHLSFCDSCLARYTALLTGDALESPETDQTLPVMRRLRRRQWSSAARRYASAAAAVAIGSTLWYCGVFQAVGKGLTPPPAEMLRPPQTQQSFEAPAPKSNVGDSILKAVNDWSHRVKKAAAPAFQMPEQSRRNTHEKQTLNFELEDRNS